MELVTALARALDRGAFDGRVARGAERAFAAVAARTIARPLHVPRGVRVVAIGGATLGGSGKTPLAEACTRFLAGAEDRERTGDERGDGAADRERTARVALIGHAYRAKPGAPRVVRPGDDPRVVGDEARVCADALAFVPGAEVIVAPTRQAAIDLAVARGARIVVLDGVAQTSPRRADLALLAVDASEPWGARACPPRGNLRAPRESLLAAADAVALVCDVASRAGPSALAEAWEAAPFAPESEAAPFAPATATRARRLWLDTPGARAADGTRVSCKELHALRFGLVTAMARPERLVEFLRARGLPPAVASHAGDHRDVVPRHFRPHGSREARPLDAWLATAKCATHIPADMLKILGIPLLVLDLEARIDDALADLLRARVLT